MTTNGIMPNLPGPPELPQIPERIIQLCVGADGTLFGLSNYGVLFHRHQNKWYSQSGEMVNNR